MNKNKLIPITLSVIFTALFVFAGAKASYLTENLFVGSQTGGGAGEIWSQLMLNRGKSADGVAFKIFNGGGATNNSPTFFINGDGSFSGANGKFAVDVNGNITASNSNSNKGPKVYQCPNYAGVSSAPAGYLPSSTYGVGNCSSWAGYFCSTTCNGQISFDGTTCAIRGMDNGDQNRAAFYACSVYGYLTAP